MDPRDELHAIVDSLAPTQVAQLLVLARMLTPKGLDDVVEALTDPAAPVSSLETSLQQAFSPSFEDEVTRYQTLKARQGPPTVKRTGPGEVYQLYVAIKAARPIIWRRLLVPGATTLDRLHEIVQRVMGWGKNGPHHFTACGVRFDATGGPDPGVLDERQFRLDEVAPYAFDTLGYVCGAGISWGFVINVEKIAAPEATVKLPACIKGRLASPPEDEGGLRGYAKRLAAFEDRKDTDHEAVKAQLPPNFDPKRFDVGEADARLRP